MSRMAAALLMLLAAGPLRAEGRPVARFRADGAVTVQLPLDLLARREVARQLSSGLTTTFAVSLSSGQQRGGARVEVRFEPWDEIYLVTTRGIDLKAASIKLVSLDRLQAWWRDAQLLVFMPGKAGQRVDVSVEVLPFSVEEQEETQRWLTRSLGEAHRNQSVDPGEVGGSRGAASVLDVLIGTSIQRRPILRYRWTVPVTR